MPFALGIQPRIPGLPNQLIAVIRERRLSEPTAWGNTQEEKNEDNCDHCEGGEKNGLPPKVGSPFHNLYLFSETLTNTGLTEIASFMALIIATAETSPAWVNAV